MGELKHRDNALSKAQDLNLGWRDQVWLGRLHPERAEELSRLETIASRKEAKKTDLFCSNVADLKYLLQMKIS